MTVNPKLKDIQTDTLFEAILHLRTIEECYMFFEDVCTITELKAKTYSEIVEETGASSATISRVNRCIHYGADGYNLILDRMGNKKKDGKEYKPE